MDNSGWQGYQLPEPTEAEKVQWRTGRRVRPVWIVAGALMAVAVGMVAVALLRPPASPTGNPGVIAAKQYLTEYQTDREALSGGVPKELSERLMTEPFEIEADLTITSDGLPEMGLPMKKLVMGLDAKYDMNDLGMKLRLLGLEYAAGYLIGDDAVVSAQGKTYSLSLGTPDYVDMSRSMGLQERSSYLQSEVPVLDETLPDGLADILAQSVPDEYTKTYTDSVYSPLDRKDVDMTVIETSLDKTAMQQAAADMDALLQEDTVLREELNSLLIQTAQYSSFDVDSVDDMLGSLVDGSALSEGDELSWQVYQRQGRYVGLVVQFLKNGEVAFEWRRMSEMEGRESHETLSASRNGQLLQSLDFTVTYNENHIQIDGTLYAGETQMVDITGDVTMEKKGDVYHLTGSVDMDGIISTSLPGNISVIIDADIRAGEGLRMLKEDNAWKDVYDEEWEPLDGTLQDLIIPQA